MSNFIAIDLQLYKIFKITRVSFFGTHCNIIRNQKALTECKPPLGLSMHADVPYWYTRNGFLNCNTYMPYTSRICRSD